MFDSGPCDWFGLPLLLPTPTTQFLLDHKRRSRKRNRKKWKRSDPSDSDSVELDSAYDSDIRFSLGHKLSYDSDFDSDSVASENQPLAKKNNLSCLFTETSGQFVFVCFLLLLLLLLLLLFFFLQFEFERRDGLMGSALISGASGPGSSPGTRGHCAVCSWARHFNVPLPTRVYKWVSASLIQGVTLRWASIPSSGE